MNLNFLLPKQPVFFTLFRAQADILREMAELFYEVVTKFTDFRTFAERAKEIEHRADDVSHSIIHAINKTFITPFDREDIYAIAQGVDDVVDVLEDVIHNIYIYQPLEKIEAIDAFADIILEAAGNISKILLHLKDQKHTPDVRELVARVHALEKEGDLAFERAIMDLFKKETDHVVIIKWKDIVENLEVITDECQGVSNVIEGIIIKSS